MPPCGRMRKKRFELTLDLSECQVLIFSDSKARFFFCYQSWSDSGHFSTWRAALVRYLYRGAFPSDDSAFWRTFLALREVRERNPATAARQQVIAMTTAEAPGRQGVSLAGWFVWREKFTWKILPRLSSFFSEASECGQTNKTFSPINHPQTEHTDFVP